MKTHLTTFMITLLIAPLGATAVFAASVQDKAEVVADNEVAKPQFKFNQARSMAQPDVVTIDGVQVARKLKMSTSVKKQLNEAKAQINGTTNVPGRKVTGI
jgi:hypothetical protein